MTDANSVDILWHRGATLMICGAGRKGKNPLLPREKAYAGEDIGAAAHYRRQGGPIGLVPFSLGLLVVDVDTYTPETQRDAAPWLEVLPRPLANLPTQSGGRHLYYGLRKPLPKAELLGPKRWRFGDIICAKRHVVLYSPQTLLECLQAEDRPPAVWLGEILHQLPGVKDWSGDCGYDAEEEIERP